MAEFKKTYKAKSVVISRKPGANHPEGLWSAFIGLFMENNPHLKGRAPFEVLELKETEKVRLRDLRNISFYLLGNDLVINNLESVTIEKKENIVLVTGKQSL